MQVNLRSCAALKNHIGAVAQSTPLVVKRGKEAFDTADVEVVDGVLVVQLQVETQKPAKKPAKKAKNAKVEGGKA